MKDKSTVDGALLAIIEQKRIGREEDVLNKLVSKLDPRESVVDRRLLYELTGMVVDIDDKY